jgi:superfamily II DNA or RNA helicase
MLDTDGHLQISGYDWISKSERLANDISFLARSLGLAAYVSPQHKSCQTGAGGIYFRVSISGDASGLPIRIERRKSGPRLQKKDVLRTSFSVRQAPDDDFYGFMLDGDGRYLLDDFTVTHNSGKSVIAASLAGEYRNALVIQHRDELVRQNHARYRDMFPDREATLYTATEKKWSRNGATFASVPTLVNWIEQCPVRFDCIVIDEAHHGCAPTWTKVIEWVSASNPFSHRFGLTATPARGDRQGLKKLFSNVADVVTLGELIDLGLLVPPRIFTLDVGIGSSIEKIKKSSTGEFDMDAAADVFDVDDVTKKVISIWREHAEKRTTIVFCTNRAHARHLSAAFNASGITAGYVGGDLSMKERRQVLKDFDQRKVQVLINVAVTIEGFDVQHASCVVLLRPSSFETTTIQMIGRGLRIVDPKRYPGIIKDDAVILDFGMSTRNLDKLDIDADISEREGDVQDGDGDPLVKDCPECQCEVPQMAKKCPICGHRFTPEKVEDPFDAEKIKLVEIDALIRNSPFQWWDMNRGEKTDVLVANALSASAVAFKSKSVWYAFSISGHKAEPIYQGHDRKIAIATSDDYLREHGDLSGARKTSSWMTSEPTNAQLSRLKKMGIAIDPRILSRYQASCRIDLEMAKPEIGRIISELSG